MISVPMTVATSAVSVSMSLSVQNAEIPTSVAVNYYTSQYPGYDGAYSFVPADEEQTVRTCEKVLMHDIIIAPIPSNYGKVTYNGSVITVS